MDKEKEILKMAQAVCCAGDDKYICVDCGYDDDQCVAIVYATHIYNAGYRKANEVRKETIGDINQLIKGVEICNSFDTEKEEDTAAFIIDEIKRAIFEYSKKKVDE